MRIRPNDRPVRVRASSQMLDHYPLYFALPTWVLTTVNPAPGLFLNLHGLSPQISFRTFRFIDRGGPMATTICSADIITILLQYLHEQGYSVNFYDHSILVPTRR